MCYNYAGFYGYYIYVLKDVKRLKLIGLRRKIMPDYSVIPFYICLIGQLLTYYGTRIINSLVRGPVDGYLDLSTAFDRSVPCIPVWSYVYFLSFAFWAVSYIIVSRESNELFYRLMTADMMSKLVCIAFFVAMPTVAIRPEVPDACGAWLMKILYAIDRPDNLFPSMHCVVTWLSFRYLLGCKKVKTGYKVFSGIAAVSIFACVLLTKQHVVVDIAAGIAVAEIMTVISNKTHISSVYRHTDILGTVYSARRKQNDE